MKITKLEMGQRLSQGALHGDHALNCARQEYIDLFPRNSEVKRVVLISISLYTLAGDFKSRLQY